MMYLSTGKNIIAPIVFDVTIMTQYGSGDNITPISIKIGVESCQRVIYIATDFLLSKKLFFINCSMLIVYFLQSCN